MGTGREIGTAVAGVLAPLGALSLVSASTTHSTTGVIIILMIAALVVIAGAYYDQGIKHSAYKTNSESSRNL